MNHDNDNHTGLRFLSVCSGIEAASVAFGPLGWKAVAFSEIEPAPCSVLKHHYPDTPNLGDMTKFKEWPDYGQTTQDGKPNPAAIDLLCGGTPCQSFSVAGLRASLADPRGNLALTFLAIAERYKPKWILWENVPGVLSSASHVGSDPRTPEDPVDMGLDGQEMDTEIEYDSEEVHAFNSFLAGLSELGYGYAYVVRDAQYVRVDGFARAVPQRRRRVFVVGYLGDWRRAAAVLFEPESMCGNPPPRREARKDVAPTIASRPTGGGGLGTDFDLDGGLIAEDVADTLVVGANQTTGFPSPSIVASTGEVAHCLNAGGMGRQDYETETMIATREVAATLTRGAESSGNGGYAGRRQEDDDNLVAHSLTADGIGVQADVAYTLEARAEVQAVQSAWAVRRLTPKECARLQGFPDDYLSQVMHNGKPLADGPMYKGLGNSWPVNSIRWIGRRIQLVEEVAEELAANDNTTNKDTAIAHAA